MRVAVTGGSGRIGSTVVKELLSRGHEVINLDRRQASEQLTRFCYVDLAAREQVQPLLESVEAVCHLGEIPNVNAGPSPEQVLAKNVRIGGTIFQTAADLELRRVVYASTCQVYGFWDPPRGAKPQSLPMDETHPIAPHNAYALSKATNEAYAKLVAAKYGLAVTVFRLPWVTPYEYDENWEKALREKPTATDGLATYCHVTDVARAFALAIESDRPAFDVYHLSANEILSLYPLAARLKAHQPEFVPLPADWPAFRSPLLANKAREHFGWTPQWNWLDFYRERHGEPAFAL